MDGASVLAYVAQILMPTFQPGDIVIADTLAAHKVEGVHAASAAAGATRRFLPPYSPDFNPIELCFATLKAIVRQARCRSIDTLWPLLGALSIALDPHRVSQLHPALWVCGRHSIMKNALARALRQTGHRPATSPSYVGASSCQRPRAGFNPEAIRQVWGMS